MSSPPASTFTAAKTRLAVARTIVRNSRIEDYASGLAQALDRGYQIGGVADFFRSDKTGRWLVLRHDVDEPRLGVERMLAVERRLGVRSSWYFRWCTFDRPLIRQVMDAGGEVGLHYETLATVLVRSGITDRAQIDESIVQAARDELRQEIQRFRTELGLTELTIASHGHPRNNAVRVSNNVIVTEDLCRETGVIVEAYSPRVLDHVACYVSDTTLLINYGWAYGQSLREAIDEGQRSICFLSHPNHWEYTWATQCRDLLKLGARGVRRQPRSFRPTFEERNPAEFRSKTP